MVVKGTTPLLGGGSRLRSPSVTYLVGGLFLVCVGLTMLAQQQAGRTVLVQQFRAAPLMHTMRQQDLARALMLKGQQLEATAQQEIKLGQQLAASTSNVMNPVAGEMLGAVNCSNTSCIGLEANGVNVDMWPQNWEVTRLPGYTPPEPINESEYNSTLDSIDEDYDFYNRKPLLDAGVNLGSWFWEPEDMDDAPKNESAPPSPEELAADEELEAILKKMENATSPEQRLARAGIKIEGMPWDPEPDYEEDYDDEEDEDEEEVGLASCMRCMHFWARRWTATMQQSLLLYSQRAVAGGSGRGEEQADVVEDAEADAAEADAYPPGILWRFLVGSPRDGEDDSAMLRVCSAACFVVSRSLALFLFLATHGTRPARLCEPATGRWMAPSRSMLSGGFVEAYVQDVCNPKGDSSKPSAQASATARGYERKGDVTQDIAPASPGAEALRLQP